MRRACERLFAHPRRTCDRQETEAIFNEIPPVFFARSSLAQAFSYLIHTFPRLLRLSVVCGARRLPAG